MINWLPIQTAMSKQQPCPRWGHSMCALFNSILIFGGYQNSKYYNDLWEFNLDTQVFSKIEHAGDIPPPCSNFTMNYDPQTHTVLLFGGGTINKEKLNDVYQLNLSTFVWKKISNQLSKFHPWQRSYHCAQIIDHYLVIFGGEFTHDLDDLWLFDINKQEWMEVKMSKQCLKPRSRKFASSFLYKNKFYIVGGCYQKYECLGDSFYLDFSEFLKNGDVSQLKWEAAIFQNMDLLKRWGHISLIKDNKAFLFGGRYLSKDVEVLTQINLETNKCQSLNYEGSAPKGRRKPGLCIKNNSLYCFSGFDGGYLKDFFIIQVLRKPEFDCIFQQKVASIESNKYICIKNSVIEVFSQKDLTNTSIYFKYFADQAYFSSDLIIFMPDGLSQTQQLKLQKIFFHYIETKQIPICNDIKLLSCLYDIAEYYCMAHLQNLIKKLMLQKFQQQILKKQSINIQLMQICQVIIKMGENLKQYIGFKFLKNIIKSSSSISNIKLLEYKLMSIQNSHWLQEILSKYRFEFNQLMKNIVFNQKQNIEEQSNICSKGEQTAAGKHRKNSTHMH